LERDDVTKLDIKVNHNKSQISNATIKVSNYEFYSPNTDISIYKKQILNNKIINKKKRKAIEWFHKINRV
jgi:hypothetical protein